MSRRIPQLAATSPGPHTLPDRTTYRFPDAIIPVPPRIGVICHLNHLLAPTRRARTPTNIANEITNRVPDTPKTTQYTQVHYLQRLKNQTELPAAIPQADIPVDIDASNYTFVCFASKDGIRNSDLACRTWVSETNHRATNRDGPCRWQQGPASGPMKGTRSDGHEVATHDVNRWQRLLVLRSGCGCTRAGPERRSCRRRSGRSERPR